jgi:hypothetical protein
VDVRRLRRKEWPVPPVIRLLFLVHLDDAIPGGALLIGLYGDGVFNILLAAGNIIDGDQANFIQAGDAVSAGEFR